MHHSCQYVMAAWFLPVVSVGGMCHADRMYVFVVKNKAVAFTSNRSISSIGISFLR